jgi:hypothetical protein
MMPETDATPVLKIRDNISLRYLKAGNGPPLVLLHTIRTQLEYFYGEKIGHEQRNVSARQLNSTVRGSSPSKRPGILLP